MVWKICVAKPSRVISVSNGISENAKDMSLDSREKEVNLKNLLLHNSEISIEC